MKEILLFDIEGDGGREIQQAVGLIADRVDFATWEPLLPMGIRDVSAIVGRDVVAELSEFYQTRNTPQQTGPDSLDAPLRYLQQAVAYFTWLRIIPTLDAQHDSNGRQRRLGENEKGLTALEQYKDEANIQRLAYDAVDALLEALDDGKYDFWLTSQKYSQRAGLVVYSKAIFDNYYVIGSQRLFLTLLPMIREVQQSVVLPVTGRDLMQQILQSTAPDGIEDAAARAIVLLTMKKAVERLPVEVLPEGVVQVNQSAPVKQKLRAEREARQAVAASLGEDGRAAVRQLESLIAQTKGDAPYVSSPIVHTKGMTF